MTLKARLTWRFLLWLFLFVGTMILLYLLVILSFHGINLPDEEDPYVGDVLRRMKKATAVEGEQVRLSEEGRGELDRLDAWLQILDAEGKEVFGYKRPSYLSYQYTPAGLSDEKRRDPGFHTWQGSVAGKKFTWVLGFRKESLLRRAVSSAALQGKEIHLPEPILQEVQTDGGWLQVLDESGREIFSHRRPDSQPDQLTAGEVSELLHRDGAPGYRIHYWRDQEKDRDWTWLLADRTSGMQDEEMRKSLDRMMNTYFLLWILATVGIAFLFGRRLGSPILHMMSWLKNLSGGRLYEPEDKGGRPVSRSGKNGKLRRPYRVYREVIQALDSLTVSLKEAEEGRARLEQSREEWITGVSHDLKTPLSSIKGYADLLATDRFEWSEEEVRQFAGTIREKSNYMEQLLEDLSLTFRLKNEALPLEFQPVDAAELIRRSAIDFANDPQFQDCEVELNVPEKAVPYPLDARWFKRAVDNLIANAAIHNPPGTRIRLVLEILGEEGQASFPALLLQVEDDGRGMDEEMAARLFDRYYRGTRTGSEKGTGLGMAIARQLVEAHRGKIQVDSRLGAGTRVEVRLPPKN